MYLICCIIIFNLKYNIFNKITFSMIHLATVLLRHCKRTNTGYSYKQGSHLCGGPPAFEVYHRVTATSRTECLQIFELQKKKCLQM